MKAFVLSVSLAVICTTSAVAAAMNFLDQVQADFPRTAAPALREKATGKPFVLASLR